MAAWKHSSTTHWTDAAYEEYRKYVRSKAASFRGRHEDCADLSIMLLIDFAALNGLAVTFRNDLWRFISKAENGITDLPWGQDLTWSTKDEFTKIVQDKVNVEALWKHNTELSPHGPREGDLMIIYTTSWGFTDRHHAALVYRTYPPSVSHPEEKNLNIPFFPGDDQAKSKHDLNQTEYFRGTVDRNSGVTLYRWPDHDTHFDYLNSRADVKRNAELIYFANARQLREDGFEFRQYGKNVLEDWSDWDGQGTPPG